MPNRVRTVCSVSSPTLAVAGSLARKKLVPPGPGTLPTVSPPVPAPSPVWTKAPAQPYAAPAPANRPDVVWTSAEGAKPYAGLVRKLPAAAR